MTNKKKEEMELLRQFAHEIGNPLHTILGFSGLIMGEGGAKASSAEIKDYATQINHATRRLAQVCERVLDESIQGHTITRKERLDFNEFCVEIVDTFAFDAKEKDISLTHHISDDFPIMHTDPVLLYEVMSNLIGNAIKFTPKGGIVTVKGEVNRTNEALILVVQDTGKGMPTTIINSLMKGGHVTTSFAHANRKGWGIGMQTALEKAELLGGKLEIERAMNGGTVMCVRLPLEECMAA